MGGAPREKALRRPRRGEDRRDAAQRPRADGPEDQDARAVLPAGEQANRQVLRELRGLADQVLLAAGAAVLLPDGDSERERRADVPELRLVRRMGGIERARHATAGDGRGEVDAGLR